MKGDAPMKKLACILFCVVVFSGVITAAEISTIKTYVDSDLCSHLVLGPINAERKDCSTKTFKEGSEPVLVQLSNNMVFQVNKTKMIKDFVGQLAEATGEVKVKDNLIKLQGIKPLEEAAIPKGDPARKLLDVRTYKATGGPGLYEKIRHELAMMPYISNFDFISFTLNGGDVILTGWTIEQTNRSYAENVVKKMEGIESVVNNIDVLPLGKFDMQIRAGARAALQKDLPQYFWGNGSDIKIIVKEGQVILLGSVVRQADSDTAYMRCKSLPGVFKVFNLLRVIPSSDKKNG
jgi:hyperosmotically inducible protein